MQLRQETTLAKVRLHWGIFIPVLLVALVPILVSLPFIILAHGLVNSLRQMGMLFSGPAGIPRLNLIWLSALAPFFVIVLGLLMGTWFTYLKSEITLTDRRLVFRTGYLSRRSGELPMENVESNYISEPLLGRLCGYGTIMLTTVGGANFGLWFIGCPQNFHSTLQKSGFGCQRLCQTQLKNPRETTPYAR